MRARIPVALRNRVQHIEHRKVAVRGVGGWPAIMELDAWEALSSAMQDKLLASAYEELAATAVEHAPVYTTPPVRPADEGLGEQRPMQAAEEYLAAQKKQRERMTTLKA